MHVEAWTGYFSNVESTLKQAHRSGGTTVPEGRTARTTGPAISPTRSLKSRGRSSGCMKVHAWVDVTCPYCWLGKHHLEEAIRQSGIPSDVEYMAFELDPRRQGSVPVTAYLADKYGDAARFEAAHEALAAAGKRFGLEYD